MKNLPPENLLHVYLQLLPFCWNPAIFDPGLAKEIVCYDLEWLDVWSVVAPHENPGKISLLGNWDAAREGAGRWRKELGELGYIVENCARDATEDRLKSRVPWMSLDWRI